MLSSFCVFAFANKVFVRKPVPRQVTKPRGTIASYGRQIYDVTLYVVTCQAHSKLLLKEFKKEDCYYLPFFPLKISSSWKDQITYCLQLLTKDCGLQKAQGNYSLLQVNQVRLPKYFDFLHQLVVYVELTSCEEQCEAGSTSSYKWFPADQLTVNQSTIWGPDPFFYLTSQATKCTLMSLQSEFKGNHQSKRRALAQSLKYTEFDLTGLYSDFLAHCYPSQSMSQLAFDEFLSKTKINLVIHSTVHNPARLFNAFCISHGSHIRFKDFIFALVALDKHCNHGGIGGELRTRCIFRYYAQADTLEMNCSELAFLFQDVALRKNVPSNPEATANALFAHLGLNQISMDQFLQLVGQLKIRGTAALFRANGSPLSEIRQRKTYGLLWPVEMSFDRLLDKKPRPKLRNTFCRQCSTVDYSLAMHSVTYQTNTAALKYLQELPRETKIPKALCERSLEMINPSNSYNQLRTILRRYSLELFDFPPVEVGSSTGGLPSWSNKTDRLAMMDLIVKISNDAKEVFSRGPRVVRVNSPVYIFGDIHGNLHDCMLYDHLFWRLGASCFSANYLFLGDYVDRGDSSLECVLYLLATKLLLPDRVHLLRGNHETREIQKTFTFFNECKAKFTVSQGVKLWEVLNTVFDAMPLCALVDEQIYCAHGGIPGTTSRIEHLYTIPVPLPQPNIMSKYAWEILWSDPVLQSDYHDYMDIYERPVLFPNYPHGFCPNNKRGTAFYWSPKALDLFLGQNALSIVIRAHEVMPSGFQFAMDGKMMTIFSCSNYCMANNEASIVFVDDDGKVRVIKVETNEKFKEFA